MISSRSTFSRARTGLNRAFARSARFLLLAPMAMAGEAHAASSNPATLTSMAQNQDVTAGALFNMIGNYAMVGGIGIAMIGLIQMAFAHKKQESMKPGAIMLIVGGVLASILAVLHSVSASVFGTDQTMTGNIGGAPSP